MAKQFFYVAGGAFFLLGIIWFAVSVMRDPVVAVSSGEGMTIAVTRDGRVALYAGDDWLRMPAVRPTEDYIKARAKP